MLLGVALVNLLRPGDGLSPETRARLSERRRRARRRCSPRRTAPKSGIDLLGPDRARQPAQGHGRRATCSAGCSSRCSSASASRSTRTEAARALRGGARRASTTSTMRLIDAGDLARADRRRGAALHAHRASSATRSWSSSRATSASSCWRSRIHQFVVYSLAVRLLGGMSPLRLLPRHPGGDAHRLLDRVAQRHAADRAPGRRGEPAACRRTSAASC